MDVSIIIPVYNTEKYLKQCLESLINQKTEFKYEIICVNDGSTDNSEKIGILKIIETLGKSLPPKCHVQNCSKKGFIKSKKTISNQ